MVDNQIQDLSNQARSRSYQYTMAYGTAAQTGDGTALPFEQWKDISKTRKFIEYDPKQTIFPTFSVQSPGLSMADPSWISIIRLNAPPEARSTIHRLALNRLPGRTPPECNCGVLDSISFNRKFQQLANATIDRDLADRANELNQAILVNLLSPLANLQDRAIAQGPAGLTFSSQSAQSSADTQHFVPLLELALF
ncbi:hypothetical protein GGH12_005976 [Coemansia sp. RSA 1822]|nr:hypothetical protein GGH12_005976 [Coemansia sp. RSA 1822]